MRALVSRLQIKKLPENSFHHPPGGLRSFRDLDTAEEYLEAFGETGEPPVL
jgi:hypothetical protein